MNELKLSVGSGMSVTRLLKKVTSFTYSIENPFGHNKFKLSTVALCVQPWSWLSLVPVKFTFFA